MSEPSREIVRPDTGEVLPLDAPTSELALMLDAVRELEWRLRGFKASIAQEVLDRMDREGTWTAHLGNVTVQGRAPGAVEYNGAELFKELLAFCKEHPDVLSHDAVMKAVVRQEVFKPRAAVLKGLAKVDDRLADIIERHTKPLSTPRNVTVKIERA